MNVGELKGLLANVSDDASIFFAAPGGRGTYAEIDRANVFPSGKVLLGTNQEVEQDCEMCGGTGYMNDVHGDNDEDAIPCACSMDPF